MSELQMENKKSLFSFALLLSVLLLSPLALAADLGPASESVNFGEDVTIYGAGFLENENTQITINLPNGQETQLVRAANSEGDLFYEFAPSQQGMYEIEVSDGVNTMTTEVMVMGPSIAGTAPFCAQDEVFDSCFGTPDACDMFLDQNACQSASCSWGPGVAQRTLFTEDFETGNPPTDWATWTSDGNGIAHVSSGNCGSGECLNGDGGPNTYFLAKQSNVDLSTCESGTAQFHIDSVEESGNLEGSDCMYVWFSNNGGANWGSRTQIFCGNNPSSSFSTTIPNSYLTSNMRMRIEKQNFGGSGENAYLDDFRVTCEVSGDICTGTPMQCDSYNDANACDAAGCNVECREATYCGDGVVQSPNDNNQDEQCDDGNDNNGDGCSNTCEVEQGWECNDNDPSFCQAANPTLPDSCGLDLVYIMDSSGSISNTELADMKEFYTDLTNALLPDTETEIAFVDFGTTGTLTLDYTDNKTAILEAINDPTIGGQTNWQDALVTAHDEFNNRLDKPDLYVFASDGEPNRIGEGPTIPVITPFAVLFAYVEANQIKLDGARIETLGVGNSLNADNFIALSSPDAYSEEAEFDALIQEITAKANAECGAEIIVQKLVEGNPTAGWEFTTQVIGGTSNPTQGVTDGTGRVLFEVSIDNQSAFVSIAETLQQGYVFESVQCTLNGQQIVGQSGDASVSAIQVHTNDDVLCVFENRECDDEDDDGICDEDDMCPGTKQNFPIDQMGCSAEQFCNKNSCGYDCFALDWMNDEPNDPNPMDCTVALKPNSNTFIPVCVATGAVDQCNQPQP